MKRGLSVLILATVLFGAFSPILSLVSEKAFAQETDDSGYSYDALKSVTIGYFDQMLTALNEKRVDYDRKKNDSASLMERYNKYEALYPKLVDLLTKSQNLYSTEFEKNRRNNLIAETQIKSLDTTTNFYFEEKRKIGNELRSIPEVASIFQTFDDPTRGQLASLKADAQLIISRRNSGDTSPPPPSFANAQAISTATSQSNAITDKSKCSILNLNLIDCIDVFLAWFIKATLLQFAGFFVYLGATLLDYSIKVGIYDFSSLAGQHFYPVWVVVKDVVNLAVLFFGLGIIILYLINKGDNIKQFVPWVILYAIFVNFSWTASRTVIDYSNILTLKMYQIVAPGAMNATAFDTNIGTSPATIIMGQLGLQTIAQRITTTNQGNSSIQSKIESTPVALLFVLMTFYTALLFFIATIIFAARTVILLLFIIFSPILLLDTVLPWIGEHVKKARNIFFSQLTVGFIFMFLFAVIVQLMTIFKPSTNIGSALTGSGSNLDSTMFFGILVVLIMLHLLLKITWNTSKGMLAPILNTVVGAALTAASGGTALIARSTIGAGAGMLARSSALDRMQGSRIGRGVMSAAQGLSNSSFNVANIPKIQQGFKSSGIPLYSPTVSYEKARTAEEERVAAKASSIRSNKAREQFLNSSRGGRLSQTLGLNSIGRNAVKQYEGQRALRLDEYERASNVRGEKGKQAKYAKYRDIQEDAVNKDAKVYRDEKHLRENYEPAQLENAELNRMTKINNEKLRNAINDSISKLQESDAIVKQDFTPNFDGKEINDQFKSKDTNIKDIAEALKSSTKIADKIEINNNTNVAASPKASPGEQNVSLNDVKPTSGGSGGATLETSNEVDLRKEISTKPNPFDDISKQLAGYINTPKPNPSI